MDRLRSFGFILKDVSRLSTRRFEEHARALCLTLPQCKALVYLSRNDGISQKRLSELCEIDPMSLVRILDRMEADGWIERRPDPQDRRARSLRITEQAKPILEHVAHVRNQTQGEMLRGFSADERNALLGLLERVHENLLALKPLPGDAARADSGGEPSVRSGAPGHRKVRTTR